MTPAQFIKTNPSEEECKHFIEASKENGWHTAIELIEVEKYRIGVASKSSEKSNAPVRVRKTRTRSAAARRFQGGG